MILFQVSCYYWFRKASHWAKIYVNYPNITMAWVMTSAPMFIHSPYKEGGGHDIICAPGNSPSREPGDWFNIKMSSYQYRNSHCGDKTILRPAYLHNWISYTGKTSLYWIRAHIKWVLTSTLTLRCYHNGCFCPHISLPPRWRGQWPLGAAT